MEPLQIANLILRIVALILAVRIALWTFDGFKDWGHGRGLPLSIYRAGLFVLMIGTISFQASRFLGVETLSASWWPIFSILALISGLMIIGQGRALAMDHEFDRLWSIYPIIDEVERLARLRLLLPEEADLIDDIIEKRIASAEAIVARTTNGPT